MPYTYDYPRPAVTADCAIFTKKDNRWYILLIQRKDNPFKGYWALPGGFMNINETIEQCAERELMEETGLRNIHLEQVHTFSDVNRDPRGRTVSVLFYGIVNFPDVNPRAGDDAKKLEWFPVEALPLLAFDHQFVIATALKKLTLL